MLILIWNIKVKCELDVHHSRVFLDVIGYSGTNRARNELEREFSDYDANVTYAIKVDDALITLSTHSETWILVVDTTTVFESPFMSMGIRSYSHLCGSSESSLLDQEVRLPQLTAPSGAFGEVGGRTHWELFCSSHTTNHTGSSASGVAEDRGKSPAA
ncbi:hypothetical protein ACMD2_10489 [Ananas comosus]|uniref:Uncharacterized protein n=1 Tax=Ananas comosus TaxID=4615 RepID=A0A199VFA3_ANACO|nr:hypothetical protein ACMD2_10489 [Ananas comosus]